MWRRRTWKAVLRFCDSARPHHPEDVDGADQGDNEEVEERGYEQLEDLLVDGVVRRHRALPERLRPHRSRPTGSGGGVGGGIIVDVE